MVTSSVAGYSTDSSACKKTSLQSLSSAKPSNFKVPLSFVEPQFRKANTTSPCRFRGKSRRFAASRFSDEDCYSKTAMSCTASVERCIPCIFACPGQGKCSRRRDTQPNSFPFRLVERIYARNRPLTFSSRSRARRFRFHRPKQNREPRCSNLHTPCIQTRDHRDTTVPSTYTLNP